MARRKKLPHVERVFVASSWKNGYHQNVVDALRRVGYRVYDYRNPGYSEALFSWDEIDPAWRSWDSLQFTAHLAHPRIEEAFQADFDALCQADACLLIEPSGVSAHMEAAWVASQGKPVPVFMPAMRDPELNLKMLGPIFLSLEGAVAFLLEHPKE